jgi:hypothetical protein
VGNLSYDSVSMIRVPIKVNNGRIVYLYGKELPDIEDGAIVELLLPDYYIVNHDLLSELQKEHHFTLFDEEELMIIIKNVDNFMKGVWEPYETGCFDLLVDGMCVPVTLTEPLLLSMRGTKKASLSGGSCKFRLGDKELNAISINNAYTIISEQLETKRKSHTGNVFDLCYYYEWKSAKWKSLNALREKFERKYEDELVFNSFVFKIGKKYIPNLEGEMLRIFQHILELGQITGREIKKILSAEDSKCSEIVKEMMELNLIQRA